MDNMLCREPGILMTRVPGFLGFKKGEVWYNNSADAELKSA